MKDITLFVGCDSVAQIKGGRYYILPNWKSAGLNETDLQGFKEHLEKFRTVCENSWSEELRNSYKEICQAVGMQSE